MADDRREVARRLHVIRRSLARSSGPRRSESPRWQRLDERDDRQLHGVLRGYTLALRPRRQPPEHIAVHVKGLEHHEAHDSRLGMFGDHRVRLEYGPKGGVTMQVTVRQASA